MNSKQAKKLSLPEIMSRFGYRPAKTVKGGREVWYKSPFRKENEASFHTSYLGGQWIWNDFGDEGGTVIDFILRHENLSKVSDALAFLDRMFPNYKPGSDRAGEGQQQIDFSFQQQNAVISNPEPEPELDRQLEFIEAYEVRNPIIFSYLEKQRKIPHRLITRYLQEIRYLNKVNGKTYFAFGVSNNSRGYEIRAASDSYKFKSALIARDLTIIKAAAPSDVVLVYESMLDFLSHLTLMNRDEPPCECIVMHSVNSYRRAANFIEEAGYRRICTLLDADEAGQRCTKQFESEFPGRVISYSHFLHPCKDVNEFLQRGKWLPPLDYLSDVGPGYTPV